MAKVISPTPGRVVWYFPTQHDGIARLGNQPLAAIVAGVHGDRVVNLAVFDAYGNTQQRSQVVLVQPGDETPDHAYASWMPYQINQASKSEQPESQEPALPFNQTIVAHDGVATMDPAAVVAPEEAQES